MPRVVLDTNVVLSAIVFQGGRTAALRAAWMTGRIVPLVSRATVEELIRVLAYPKFRLTRDEQETLLADYLIYTETAATRRSVTAIPECRDPSDLPFLQLAVGSKADYLVTGDPDLLELTHELGGRIITPGALLQRLAGTPSASR